MRAHLLIAALFLTTLVSSPAAAQTTAVRFGKLWDGSQVMADAVVVVNGDRITAVGTGSQCRAERRRRGFD